MLRHLEATIKKHPLAWFCGISVLVEIAIIPVFYFTGSDDALMNALNKSEIPFKTDLITAFRVVMAAPEAFPGVLLAIVQVAAVDIAVFIVAKIAYGQQGIADLKARFRFWQKDIPWQCAIKIWGICIVIFSFINLAAAGLNKLMFPDLFVWDINLSPIHFLVSLAITLFLDSGGLFEENGWRGFALPLLLRRFNPLNATLILELLWGLWHFPVKYNLFTDFGFSGGFVYLSIFTLRLVFVSILMTHFWNRLGQTTIIAIAMHGLINDSLGLGGKIESEYFIPQLFTEINLLIPTAIVAIFLISQTVGRLGIKASN
jgi:uncharacterized protein